MSDEERRAAARAWFLSRPSNVQALMKRFPPLSHVSATVTLHCPMPGHSAEVVGYTEPSDESPEGTVIVVGDSIFGPIKTYCEPGVLVLDESTVDPETREILAPVGDA